MEGMDNEILQAANDELIRQLNRVQNERNDLFVRHKALQEALDAAKLESRQTYRRLIIRQLNRVQNERNDLFVRHKALQEALDAAKLESRQTYRRLIDNSHKTLAVAKERDEARAKTERLLATAEALGVCVGCLQGHPRADPSDHKRGHLAKPA